MSTDIIIYGDLHINHMQVSAFFAGNVNVANNWDSHSKSNTVLKVTSDRNKLQNNISVIYDSDLIDTCIDDRDVKITYDYSNDSGQTNINMDTMVITSMEHTSAGFFGKGHITGMDAHVKDNFGMGPTIGHHNKSSNHMNKNDDQDLIDSPIYDSDIKLFNQYR